MSTGPDAAFMSRLEWFRGPDFTCRL